MCSLTDSVIEEKKKTLVGFFEKKGRLYFILYYMCSLRKKEMLFVFFEKMETSFGFFERKKRGLCVI